MEARFRFFDEEETMPDWAVGILAALAFAGAIYGFFKLKGRRFAFPWKKGSNAYRGTTGKKGQSRAGTGSSGGDGNGLTPR